MPKTLVLSILLVSAGAVTAAVKPGEDLLINGAFEAGQISFPAFWEKGGSNIVSNPTGGPGNTGAVVFSNPEGLAGSVPLAASTISRSSPAKSTG